MGIYTPESVTLTFLTFFDQESHNMVVTLTGHVINHERHQ